MNVRDAFLLLPLTLLSACSAPQGPILSPENLLKARDLVAQSESVGMIIRHTCVGDEAYVNPSAWAEFDVDEKRGMTISLAAICEAENSGARMTIIDHQSGKRLAAYTSGSFEVF